MDNQNNNTNGVFGNNNQFGNPIPNPMQNTPQNLEATNLENSRETIPTSNTNSVLNSTPTPIEPVKPTLDSILNGDSLANGSVSSNVGSNTNQNPSMENSVSSTVVNNNMQATPTFETIPENMLKEEPVEVTPQQMVVESNEPSIIGTTPTSNGGTVLGSIEENPIPVVNPVINETTSTQNVETLESSQPVEEIQVPPTVETPIDDFHEVPVPPVFDEDKKGKKDKQNGSKLLIVVLIVILIAAIGFGVYYFLTLAKSSATSNITIKDVKLELGNSLPTNIDIYANITGYNKSDCKLNLDNVNVNKVSTYKYTITCGKTTEEGIVMVDDTTKPEVVVNDLILLPNATVNPEDFIEECVDASKCSYTFKDNIESFTRTIGEHTVEIIVSDEYNNQNTVIAKLTIANTAPSRYLTCKKTEENSSEFATLVDTYKIGIDASDNFYNAVRTAEFTFKTANDYNSAVQGYNESIGIHSIIGTATFNEKSNKIIIKSNKTLDDMNRDLNGRLPNNFNILRAYLSGLGYTCN